MPPPIDTSDPRWQLTLRILHSTLFEKSPRLRAFLRFICEFELTGRRLQIGEHQIGVDVFGRTPGYNPSEDSIVRSQARFLRKRLEEYFLSEGVHEAMRIVIPKGSYVPLFEAAAVVEALLPAQPEQPAAAPSVSVQGISPGAGRKRPGRRFATVSVALALCLLAGLVLLGRRASPFDSPESRFWNAVFDPHRTQVIVPADSTLILIEELTGRQIPLDVYLSRSYLTGMLLPQHLTGITNAGLAVSHYTSMADLNFVSRIVRVPGVKQMRAEVRYARDLSISDAKEDNLVLIGGPRANPWVELFASHMNFYVDYNGQTQQNTVIDKSPRSGEAPLYVETSSGPATTVYGLIAFQPSLDREGDALLAAGTSSAGTQAAADFLMSGRSFSEFLRRIQRRDGAIPHFELLLEARSLGGNIAQSSIVASRVYP